ncbi:MAG: translation initiation factor IF-1 [Acidobacteriota bacterium]
MADAPPPDDARHVEGVVLELLPSQLARVAVEGTHVVTAHLGEPVHRNFVRVLVGDRVRVVLMPADRTRGRIVEKLP